MEIVHYIQHNWLQILEIIGDILACDAVVKQVAVKYGFKELASLCDLLATGLNFCLDIAIGLISALKHKKEDDVKTNTQQKVD